jgi:beta-lactamase regulating signal transducer with metallopeptidase domain
MEKNDKDFSPQESLLLIRSMIETTRHSISDHSHYYLLWGWAVMIGCIVQYLLMSVFKYPHHYYAWFITLLALVIQIFFIIKDKKKERVKTFINEANSQLWMIIGFSFIALFFIFGKMGWMYCFPIYILLYGIGTSVSGSLIKFKPLIIGGIANIALSIITVYLRYDLQILMTALAILISYIIPGHLLHLHYRKTNLHNYATEG